MNPDLVEDFVADCQELIQRAKTGTASTAELMDEMDRIFRSYGDAAPALAALIIGAIDRRFPRH